MVDRLFDRTVQLNKALLPLMQAAEQTLGLDERTRSRTLVRIDAGGGCVDDVNWLLARGYQVIGKDYSPARAERLAQSVLWWADDPKVPGRQVGWMQVPATEYVRPMRRFAVRCRKANGQWGVGVLLSTLDPVEVLALTQPTAVQIRSRRGCCWRMSASIDSFTKPTSQRPEFIAHRPGVVNGLQTVVALHTAYQQLDDREKEDFEKNCSVLVRLLVKSALEDITRVVKATNNQNPMKPRNLVSNNLEQLIYTRIFASELVWFYQAKEGAWDAFVSDPKRWRPDLHKRPKDFRFINSRKNRRIDNEDLAQTWLAFIGFANEAVNEKKALFDSRFYPLRSSPKILANITHKTMYYSSFIAFIFLVVDLLQGLLLAPVQIRPAGHERYSPIISSWIRCVIVSLTISSSCSLNELGAALILLEFLSVRGIVSSSSSSLP